MNNNTTNSASYPPSKSTCPDYWTVNSDDKSCNIPAHDARNAGEIYDSAHTI